MSSSNFDKIEYSKYEDKHIQMKNTDLFFPCSSTNIIYYGLKLFIITPLRIYYIIINYYY